MPGPGRFTPGQPEGASSTCSRRCCSLHTDTDGCCLREAAGRRRLAVYFHSSDPVYASVLDPTGVDRADFSSRTGNGGNEIVFFFFFIQVLCFSSLHAETHTPTHTPTHTHTYTRTEKLLRSTLSLLVYESRPAVRSCRVLDTLSFVFFISSPTQT